MGTVYKVFDRKIGEVVALKLIRPELAVREKTLQRFRDEIRLSRKITHRNVCRMYDLSEEGGTPYITMEYISGEDLKSTIKMMRQLSPAQTVAIGKQICEGLAEAHKLGIVHRDLKPKNIMIDRDGKARIMDFGLARSLEEKGITGGPAMIGTPEYMSPEQVEGQKTDNRADIYSLGIILFEMVTGRPPFEGESAISIAVKHKTEPPPDPRKYSSEIPEGLVQLILKCLEKRRERRYQTCDEVLADLLDMEKEMPSAEKIFPDGEKGIFEKIADWLKQKKFLFAGLGLAAALIVLIFIFRKPSPPPISPPPEGLSLAILYFSNQTGDPNLDILSKSLSTNLISELQRSSGQMTVLTADVILYYLNKLNLAESPSYSSEDLKELVSLAKVGYVLFGYITRAGDRLRITYDLRKGPSLQQVDSDRVEGHSDEQFVLVDNVARKIRAAFGLSFVGSSGQRVLCSAQAERYYELGRHAERKYRIGEKNEDLLEAIEWFNKAKVVDPGCVLAYLGLGDVYQDIFVNTNEKIDLEMMVENYQRAYEINPNLADSNAGLGWVFFFREDIDQSYEYFRRAHEIAPEDTQINVNVGSFLNSIGLIERAIEYFTKAIKAGDKSAHAYLRRARFFENAGSYSEAAGDARKAMELEPNEPGTICFYARELVMMKKFEEAEKELAIAETISPGNPSVQACRALLRAAQGEREEALESVKIAERDPIYYTYLLSRVYAILGLNEEAINNIALANESGFQVKWEYFYTYQILNNRNDYFYDSIRTHPRFLKILEKEEAIYTDRTARYSGL